MSSYQSKLVFVGSMGAGKTTAIRAISDVDPVSTEMPISGELVMPGKETTTVALDYSTVELGDGELLHVYGVPGQAYLDFMWPMVCDGAMGIIVLVNACDPQRVESTVGLLEAFSRMAPQACFVVGVTCADLEMDFSLMDFRDALLARGFTLPVLKVDARASVQVELLVRILLSVRFAGSQLAAEVAQGASHAVADA